MENVVSHSWWRNNLSLIVGVCLPVLLVLLFWLAMIIPRMTVDDPGYDLIVASRYNGARLDGNLDFEVRGSALVARFTPNARLPGNEALTFFTPAPKLYYFSTTTGSLRELAYTLPEDPAGASLIPLDLLEGRIVSGESVAPDGYRFDNSYRGSRGFLFVFDGYRFNAKIEKGGRAIKIPSIDRNSYIGDYAFVAWVEQEED